MAGDGGVRAASTRAPVPLTVVGGYLGAGKTTLLNRLLRDPGGRRLGVVVNDFGALPIDADLLDGSDGGVVSLPNGCVCCSLGADLSSALAVMMDVTSPPDHVVIEASGVADPAAVAAWGTLPPFEPGGVIVLAAADTVRRQARDRYVGGEVRRQIAAADLVVVTKPDLVGEGEVGALGDWLDEVAPGAPRVAAEHGAVPADVILGLSAESTAPSARHEHDGAHGGEYVTWSWRCETPVVDGALERFLDALPEGVLRLKGWIAQEGRAERTVVQVVGRRRDVVRDTRAAEGSALVAIGLRSRLDPADLDAIAPA